MKYPTRVSEKALSQMAIELREATGDGVSVELECWKYKSNDETIKYQIWFTNGSRFAYAPTWKDLCELHKKELENATKHS